MEYTEHLDEKLLGIFLYERFKTPFEYQKRLKIDDRRFIPDYTNNQLDLIVEFDGPYHFTSAKTAVIDLAKDTLLSDKGLDIIRIPYYIQLNNKNIEILFSRYDKTYLDMSFGRGESLPCNNEHEDTFDDNCEHCIGYNNDINSYSISSCEDFNIYPDGFDHPDAMLPANFCSLGLDRFYRDMNKDFKFLRETMIESLDRKVSEGRNILLVYPLTMLDKKYDETGHFTYIKKEYLLTPNYNWGE